MKGCGRVDENRDICGETFTCAQCRMDERFDLLLAERRELVETAQGLLVALAPRFMRAGCSAAEEAAVLRLRAAIAKAVAA